MKPPNLKRNSVFFGRFITTPATEGEGWFHGLAGEADDGLQVLAADAERPASHPEYQFFWDRRHPIQAFHDETGLGLFAWGCHDKGREYPRSGWLRAEDLDAGKLDHLKPEPVDIPAIFAFANGRWYMCDADGIRGLLIRNGVIDRVYLLTTTASHYFKVMTGLDREPVFVGRQI
jgi:hypothetical protein